MHVAAIKISNFPMGLPFLYNDSSIITLFCAVKLSKFRLYKEWIKAEAISRCFPWAPIRTSFTLIVLHAAISFAKYSCSFYALSPSISSSIIADVSKTIILASA